jgi:hypothetical protein
VKKIASERNYRLLKEAVKMNGLDLATSQQVSAADKVLSDRLDKFERILQEVWAKVNQPK